MASEERAEPRLMTSREHAERASELAAAIQPFEDRFREEMRDPEKRLQALALGAIKAHDEAVDHAIRTAEMHARVADVLLRTDGAGVSHDEAVQRAAVELAGDVAAAKRVVAAIFPLSELRVGP